jgi:FPC/CPF motif-containing protein YcgG
VKDEAETAARMKERKAIRARIEELNAELREELSDDAGDEERESRLATIAEIQELEHKLDDSGDDD